MPTQKITETEKRGKVTSIEEVKTNDDRTLWRVLVNTAVSMDLQSLKDVSNITDFLLAANERTEFSVLMPTIKDVTTEQITKLLVDKDVDIIVFKARLTDLSNGQIERVSYERNDGNVRITSSMSRTYIKGSSNANAEIAFDAMRDELKERITNDEFTIVSDAEETPKQAQAPKPKQALNF
jgi:hypothetical protein